MALGRKRHVLDAVRTEICSNNFRRRRLFTQPRPNVDTRICQHCAIQHKGVIKLCQGRTQPEARRPLVSCGAEDGRREYPPREPKSAARRLRKEKTAAATARQRGGEG